MDILKEDEKIVDNELELDVGGQKEENIYPMNGIKVDKGFYTIFELKRRYDASRKRIILDSDFQREDVWGPERKAELVESVLMGLPLPIFYFTQDKYGMLIVVDGRQRLTTLFSYMDDKFALAGLTILPDLNKKKFSDLSPLLQGRLEDFQIQAHVIMPPTPDRIKFDIFDRVNRGGIRLNKQEMRNALYQGEATKLLNRLIKSTEFAEATDLAFKKETRMKDKYLLTRFIAFWLYREGRIKEEGDKKYIYKNDIDEILGKGMDTLNHMSDKEIQSIEKFVLEILKKSHYYLGKDAFRLMIGQRKTPINMNVFETVMYMLQYIPANNEEIRKNVKADTTLFLKSDEFQENIGNHRDSAVKLDWRLSKAEELGRRFI